MNLNLYDIHFLRLIYIYSEQISVFHQLKHFLEETFVTLHTFHPVK